LIAGDWLSRAKRSLESARLLIDAADYDAACSRAYYATHYAARAALLYVGEEEASLAKTHRGMVANFSNHIVKPGHLPVELSKIFGREEKRRLVADYQVDGLGKAEADEALVNARVFVLAVTEFCRYGED
jgi:uncharacterized protein (UPF0332 family)